MCGLGTCVLGTKICLYSHQFCVLLLYSFGNDHWGNCRCRYSFSHSCSWLSFNPLSLQVDPQTHDGLTPLHCAARSGFAQVAKLLVEAGAVIGAKTKNKLHPLHMATQVI